jgi:hypothetical protein
MVAAESLMVETPTQVLLQVYQEPLPGVVAFVQERLLAEPGNTSPASPPFPAG